MNKIILGDCLIKLKELEDNSIDSIVTDPPYELGFMGKSWDNTGIANNPLMWAECLRVLKPGGYLLSFGGTRTYHRMAVAIEDAGFEVRDMIEWVYGSGFPKSHNVGLRLDQKLGLQGFRGKETSFSAKVIQQKYVDGRDKVLENGKEVEKYTGKSEIAKQYQGWGTALKPAHEPICMARKPLAEKTVAENCLKYGTGGLNIDESRIEFENTPNPATNPKYRLEAGYKLPTRGQESKTEIKFRSSLNETNIKGRFPANLLLDEEAAQELDKQSGISRSRANIKSDNRKNNGKSMFLDGIHNPENSYNDTGGASRFFKVIEDDYPRFIYCAKASPAERNMGCEGLEEKKYQMTHPQQVGTLEDRYNVTNHNNHPTVKPLKLMEYLCILTRTPSGGIVLDPFVGSGTTCMAAKKIGRDFIGIEREADYCAIARVRIKAIKPNLTLNLK